MKNILKQHTVILALFLLLLGFVACTPDPPPVGGEEEIDEVTLSFSNGPTVSWELNGTEPEIVLNANTTYTTVSASFRNAADNEDITAEILTESVDHLVCFTPNGTNVTITRTDKDANDLELGLTSSWETGEASTGTLNLSLKHQPGVKDGSCEPGDANVEVLFNIVIQ
ncbi:MAG: hypothetical protein AAF587_35280 [Bacteroidota bacterium]